MKKSLSVIVALIAVIAVILIAVLVVPTLVVLLLSLLLHFTFTWNYVFAAVIIELWFTSMVKTANIKNQ